MPVISTSASSQFSYQKMGSGPALVLIHGFPEASSLWRNICTELAKSFTLLMPDLPGSGPTPLQKDTSIADMADAVIAMLNAEHIAKAVVAGHSMGGYVAFSMAARYPLRLAGLSVVHSTPAADDEEKTANRLKAIKLIENGGKDAFVRQMIRNLFAPGFIASSPLAVEEQIALSLQVEASGLINYYRAMIARPDHAAALKDASFPVQWLLGMLDNVMPYKKILPYCSISDTNFVTFYNNCGHMSMLENPERLIGDLKEFAGYCYNRT